MLLGVTQRFSQQAGNLRQHAGLEHFGGLPDAWLHNKAPANDTDRVPVKRIYQYGPNCVRDSRDLRAALAILAERGRARMEEDGRRRVVAINPALLDARE